MTGATRQPSVESVLVLAGAVLDGTIPMPKGRATRAAALLARQALEEIVRTLCSSAGFDMDRATMRSRLILLRELVDNEAANRAEVAWAGLSRACHQHAYDLAPTTIEVEHLITLVSELHVDTQAIDRLHTT